MTENKDFYVIELKSKIKVGITNDFKSRLNSIKTGSGIKDNEILNIYYYPDLGFLEARIKRLFSKQKIAGEWFYKRQIVLIFIECLKNGDVPSLELLKKVQNESVKELNLLEAESSIYGDYLILKQNAINLLDQIKSERFGIGYPDSVELAKFMRLKKANYRNMVYNVDECFKYFERVPKFCLEDINDNQIIECLRIIKNTTANNIIKTDLQDKIDSIFSKSDIYRSQILELINSFFFIKTYDEKTKSYHQNIEMKYDEECNMYFMNNFEDLNKEERLFLKKVQNENLMVSIFGTVNFSYKNRYCGFSFEVENFLRVLNFFKIRKTEENQIRLFVNDTNHKECIFQYKYHLLNCNEKQFIRSLYITDHSFYYIEFEKNGRLYYCLFDDWEPVQKDLKIKIKNDHNDDANITIR